MRYDLVIKNGTVIDGSGLPRYRADVGVRNRRIATIGRIRENAQQMIDAEGQVVAGRRHQTGVAASVLRRTCSPRLQFL